MRIGVVCEGPTDFFAIHSFLGHALRVVGIEASFVPLQPKMDNTAPTGGWANVLLWLGKNPPAVRVQQYFDGGLFGGGLSTEPLDGILLQLDSDILDDQGFVRYVHENYGHAVANPAAADVRAEEVRTVLSLAARLSEMTIGDVNRHVLAPAVESTESWCVAAFTTPTKDFELLSGQQLVDAFMTALEVSESTIPTLPYANINKSTKRRRRFCEAYSEQSGRVANGCARFREVVDQLSGLA